MERPLGRGGMGAVYLAHDALLGRAVALKRAQRREPADLLRFKREFRVIERLTHPNLVRLYELGSDDEGLYYTMEAIDGTDLGSHCAAGDRVERLRRVLPSLLDALAFLHAHGVVHCDLKPSNVLVARDGTVKLLDFGVLAELSSSTHDAAVAGTPAYLAPERIRGEPATPATDLYALGCTIFEVLTGRPPFVGTTSTVLAAHASEPPPRVLDLAPDIPEDLDALCRALMAKEPSERPTISALRREGPALSPLARTLVGRDALSRSILARLDGGARPLVLSGPTGVGKSAMLEWLAGEASRRGMVVLRSAARSTERLAYNALDAALDDLARTLMKGDRSFDRRAQRIAAEAFPLLRAGSRALDEARERVRAKLFGVRETHQEHTRREIFDAVARLLDDIAGDRGALLVVDDAQWADVDSIALLRHLLERTRPEVHIALVLRNDVTRGLAHAWLEAEGIETIEVPPLAPEHTAAIVRRTAEQLGAHPSEEALAAAARACHGRPFLAEVAGRALAQGSSASLDDQLAAAWHREGELLAVLVAGDGWMPVEMLAAILGRPLGAIDEALRELERAGLVRCAGGALDGFADLYHDGVRTAALGRLAASERVALHGRIADYLLGAKDAPPQRLVRHLASAGRVKEAAIHARRAAELAIRQRAFGSAADMYAVVLEADPHDRAAREARAWALEQSSRYAEAASEWAELARDAPPEAARDLALHEAHALLAASRMADGLRRLDTALARSGYGRIDVRGVRALATLVRFAMGPTGRARTRPQDPARRLRAERHLKIGILLAFIEPITGIRFLQHARAEFLRAGADAQVAGCDVMFAILAFAGSRNPDRVPLAERYLEAARARARGIELPPDVRGMLPFVEGLRRMRQGRWAEARALFDQAVEIFRESTGTTEVTLARSWLMMMAAHMQDVPEMRRHVDFFHRHADDSGGTLLVPHIALVDGYVKLLEGRFDDGYDALTHAADLFDDDPPNAQRAALRLYRHAANIYRDDGRRARRELAAELRRARPFRFLNTMYAGTLGVMPALIEANALRSGDRGASARRVERLARIVDSAPPLWAGASWRARAYAADALGRPDRALAHLARAEAEAARFDRRVDVAIARWQRGRRIGGDLGAELCADARAIVDALGVSPLVLEEDAGLR